MELVANVLVNATSMTEEIVSGDVAIVSSLLDRVSDQIGSNTSDPQDTGGMEVSGQWKISPATVHTIILYASMYIHTIYYVNTYAVASIVYVGNGRVPIFVENSGPIEWPIITLYVITYVCTYIHVDKFTCLCNLLVVP